MRHFLMVFKHCVIAAAEAWKRLKKKVLIAWDTKNFSLQGYRVINPCTALFCYDCAKKTVLYYCCICDNTARYICFFSPWLHIKKS